LQVRRACWLRRRTDRRGWTRHPNRCPCGQPDRNQPEPPPPAGEPLKPALRLPQQTSAFASPPSLRAGLGRRPIGRHANLRHVGSQQPPAMTVSRAPSTTQTRRTRPVKAPRGAGQECPTYRSRGAPPPGAGRYCSGRQPSVSRQPTRVAQLAQSGTVTSVSGVEHRTPELEYSRRRTRRRRCPTQLAQRSSQPQAADGRRPRGEVLLSHGNQQDACARRRDALSLMIVGIEGGKPAISREPASEAGCEDLQSRPRRCRLRH
jgi:hypothetical protein